MIDPPKLHEAAIRFGSAIRSGVMTFADCHDLMCQAAVGHPIARNATRDQLLGLCDRLARTLAASVDDPTLTASQHVRDAIRPLFARRASRDCIELTAYRTAGDDLTVRQINSIIHAELAVHMQSRKSKNA